MLTEYARKRLKKNKRKQFLSYDTIKVETSSLGVVMLSIWHREECISRISLCNQMRLGDTISINNLQGELEVNLKLVPKGINTNGN